MKSASDGADVPPPRTGDQLRAAARLTDLGTFSVDVAANRVALDERSRQILGWQDPDLGFQALLQAIVARIHPDDTDDVRRVVLRSVAAGGPFEIHGRLTVPGRGDRWVSAAGTVATVDGTAVSVSGAVVDHTEQRLREERWLRGQKREALGALAAGIAHDLNNVMGAVMGNVALARLEFEQGASPDQSLREVEGATQRAAEMLRRLLSFGRDDAPGTVRFDLAAIAAEACALLAPTIDAAIELVPPDPSYPSPVDGDANQIHQLVINLVTNAVAVLPGGGRVLVSIDRRPGEDRTLRLRVTDDGPGIPDAIRPRIFDPFFTTKAPGEGTGLGLAAALAITEMHGGTISVRSIVGEGTSFTVLLPEDVGRPVDPARARSLAGGMRYGKARVAVVASSAAVRRQAESSMPSFGCIPVVFADGPAALAALALDPTGFDALVCDASARAGAQRLIRRARAVRDDLPVVVYAGPDTELTRSEAHALGVDAWVPRPGPPSELCAAIMQLVR